MPATQLFPRAARLVRRQVFAQFGLIGFLLLTTCGRQAVADHMNYRFVPLAQPEQHPVRFFGDLEAFPKHGLLASNTNGSLYVHALDGTQIGLYDAAHTSPQGIRATSVLDSEGFNITTELSYLDASYTNGQGQIVGVSQRFFPAYGQSAWLYDPSDRVVTQLAYVDDDHRNPEQIANSTVIAINEVGHVLGTSVIGDDLPGNSRAAWVYRSDTRQYHGIGLLHEFVADGPQAVWNWPITLDEAGNTSGITISAAVDPLAWSSWYHAAGEAQARRIGTFIGEPLPTMSRPAARLTHGHIIGTSSRAGTRRWTWVYDPIRDESLRIGLFDAEHTSSDNYAYSTFVFQSQYFSQRDNVLPFALGHSRRYAATTVNGQSAWIYDPSLDETRRLGIFSPQHHSATGQEHSEIVGWNSEQIVGFSRSYGSSGFEGSTTWLYDVESYTIRQIGLDGGEFRRADGTISNTIHTATSSGFVVGTTILTLGDNASHGAAVWAYDPTSEKTRRIGFFGDEYRLSDGYEESSIIAVGEYGHVFGLSLYGTPRFPCGTPSCDTVIVGAIWLYDPVTGETTEVDDYGLDDGTYLGEIKHIDEGGTIFGDCWRREGQFGYADRACLWTREDGLIELDATVARELPGFDMPTLTSIDGVSTRGVIVGTMTVGSRSAPFALVPVPEPNGAALAALAAVVLVGMERRRRTCRDSWPSVAARTPSCTTMKFAHCDKPKSRRCPKLLLATPTH